MKTQVEMMKSASLEAAMDLSVSFVHLHNVSTASAATQALPVRRPRLQLGQAAPSDITGLRSIMDLHAVPLGRFDIVLGTHFLKTLRPILWDFSVLWMS